MVSTKQVVHAKMAVQKFCAISLGYVWRTANHPPLTPATAFAGRVVPWWSAAATVGGMMANNSSGARSVYYGKTIDHVLEQALDDADYAEVTKSLVGSR